MNFYPFFNQISSFPEENYLLNYEMHRNLEHVITLLKNRQQEIDQLRRQNYQMKAKIDYLEQKLESDEKKLKLIKKPTKNYYRKNAVSNNDKESRIYCPYDSCNHHYSSNLALNFHIKFKHNGGNKKQRQAYAKIIVQAEQMGQEPPKIYFNFPPGFLEKYRLSYFKQKKLTELKENLFLTQKQLDKDIPKTE